MSRSYCRGMCEAAGQRTELDKDGRCPVCDADDIKADALEARVECLEGRIEEIERQLSYVALGNYATKQGYGLARPQREGKA